MPSDFSPLPDDMEPLGSVSGFINEFLEAVRPGAKFHEFNRGETIQLTDYFECYGIPRNQTVLTEGLVGDSLMIILTGGVRIVRNVDGHPVEVARLGPGSIVGEISFFDGLPRTATCITDNPSDIAVLSHAKFFELNATNPRLANKFLLMLLKHAASRLRNSTEDSDGFFIIS